MGTYKQFNSQDIIITPIEVNKGFSFSGNNLTGSDVGIDRFIGQNGNFLSTQSTTGKISGSEQYEVLIYDSIKHLYYSNYLSGSGGFTSDAITSSVLLGADREGDTLIGDIQQTNYYNYEQTTLWPNKTFPTSSIGVISIPSKLFGDYIQPNSLLLEHPESGSIIDDGEGRLLWKNVGDLEYSYILGNIIYQHGIVTLFDTAFSKTFSNLYGQALYGLGTYKTSISPEELLDAFITSNNVTCSFSSSYEIFETQYKCTVTENEFNYTLNPSTLSGSKGDIYDQFTGSYFDPYVTTVGLYSPDYELLAIGKLAKPLPTSRTTDTTILINIDR
jgi:hypothetical protein